MFQQAAKKNFSVFYYLIIFSLIILKEPSIFLYPRFWAEEGMVFYAFAYHNSFWDNLFTPLVGYYTFYNVIVSSLQVNFFSIENAPIVSTVAGLIVQITPFILILNSYHPFWDTNLKKLLHSLIIIFITPNEIWVNTTNSHFHFGLITFIILVAEPNKSKLLNGFIYIMLILACLTGPMSVFFAPFFILKYFYKKNSPNLIQMVIANVCGAIQVFVTIYSVLYKNTYQRFVDKNLWLSFKAYIADNFGLLLPFGENDRFIIGLVVAPIAIYLFIKLLQEKKKESFFFIASFFLVSILSILGSLNMTGGPRYGFVPTFILICLFFNFLFKDTLSWQSKLQRNFFYGLFGIFLLIQGIGFKLNSHKMYLPEFPKWRSEVEKWRKDSTYTMKIHPYNENKGWIVKLDKRPFKKN